MIEKINYITMNKIFLTIIVFCELLLFSCEKESFNDPGHGKVKDGGFSLAYSIQGQSSETATRAGIAPEDGEENVNDIVLLFFAKTADGSGEFQDYIVIAPVEGEKLRMNDPIKISYQGKSLDASTSYNILAVANISGTNYIDGELEDWAASWSRDTEYQAKEKAIVYAKGATNNDSNAIQSDAIIMSGSTSVCADQSSVNIVFTRDVARFDVTTNLTVKKNYDLVSVSIWNAYPKASLFNDGYLNYGDDEWRIKRFYGVDNSDNTFEDENSGETLLGDIVGGLYAFINRVGGPQPNDTYTTCLIIGLHKRDEADGQVTYYRVNMHPEGSGQSIKRNNVYKLTIRNVLGPGKGTEGEAYSGVSSELEYTINYWDLDDNGLIVQDQNSMMSLPVKTVRFGQEGGENEYHIYSFTTLTTKPVLTMTKQEYNVSGRINAHLEGNTLFVTADPMDDGEEDRTGMITLRYAGLTATLTVLQSASVDKYLTVTRPPEGIPVFPSLSGASSGNISVTASGPWTATIYLDGFSFLASNPSKTTLKQIEATDNKFKIWTSTPNTTDKARQGVLVVSLDDDPEHYSSAIVFSQKAPGGITTWPETGLFFTGVGDPESTGNVVNVFPSVFNDRGESANPRYELYDWKFELLDFTTKTAYQGNRFQINPTKELETNNPVGMGVNKITVTTNGANNSSTPAKAILRISLVDHESKYSDIVLTQRALMLRLDPGIVPDIPVTGGETQLITVEGAADMKWKATTAVHSGSGTGKTVMNHAPVFYDQHGNILDMSQPHTMDTKFKVYWPKIYWPNREIKNIYVSITVELLNADNSSTNVKANTLVVNQESLNSKGFYAWDVRTGWGSLRDNSHFGKYINDIKLHPGYELSTAYVKNGNKKTTYIHLGTKDLRADYNWTEIESFRQNQNGITIISADEKERGAQTALNDISGPFKPNGYVLYAPGSGSTGDPRVNKSVSNTRVYQFLMKYGGGVKTPEWATREEYKDDIVFKLDGTHSEATQIPPSAVPIIINVRTNAAIMTIDPANKLVMIGECQMFDEPKNDTSNGNGYGFMRNFLYYVENAAKYGDHFTDMLRDSLHEGGTNEPNPIAEPWNDIWGANKWTGASN